MWERKEIMSKKSRSCDSWKRKYDVISEEKQEGGNGFVYFVRKNGEEYALKQLKEKYIRSDKEKRKRFIVEIQTVKRVSGYIMEYYLSSMILLRNTGMLCLVHSQS